MTKAAAITIATVFSALLGGCGTRTSIGGIPDGGGGTGSGGTGGGGAGGGDAGGDAPAACGNGTGGRAWSQQPVTPSFAATTYPVAGPGEVALGDLDGDGKTDLAVATLEGVNVLRNNGDGTFAPQVNHAPAQAYALALGDLTGDGKTDIVALNGGGAGVSRNEGNATFAAPVQYAVGNNPNSVALGDLNGDGKIDIVVANSGGGTVELPDYGDVGVLLNTGGGTFVAASYPAGVTPTAIVLGDLNGDCRPDLAVTNPLAGLSVLLGQGDGTFAPPASYAAGTNADHLALGDLNGDGRADLALAGVNRAYVSVVLNIGNGRFGAAVNYPVTAGYRPGSVAMGDFNGDGRRDLIVPLNGDSGFGGLGVFLNQEAGTFATPVRYPVDGSQVSPVTVSIGDLNGDGKDDVVSATWNTVTNLGIFVAVRLNTSP